MSVQENGSQEEPRDLMASGFGGSGLSTEIKEPLALLASYTQGLSSGHGHLSAGQGQPPAHAQYWPHPDSATPETPPWWSQQTWGWPPAFSQSSDSDLSIQMPPA